MTPDPTLVQRLAELLESVKLGLAADDDGYALSYENQTYRLATLPLDGLAPEALQAELMAVAAALEAAIKYPGSLAEGEDLKTGAAALLPKVERRRFVDAYNAVIDGAGLPAEQRIYHRDFGEDLVVAYVHDEGWRFSYIVEGRFRGWDTTSDTIHSVARSNLYARSELDYRAHAVAVGDGYDAARAVLMDDVFFDRAGPGGIPVAIPSRDELLVGPGLTDERVRSAYEAARYPISPHVMYFEAHRVSRRT